MAVELPDELRSALRRPLEELATIDDIRPSPAEQIHLTLHFLDSVDVAKIPAIRAALLPAIALHKTFELRAKGVDAFGGARRPRVLWAGFADSGIDQIKALRSDTAKALAQIGFETEPDFQPHLTLGRARRPIRAEGRRALQGWYARWNGKDFGRLPVHEVALMRSQLGGGPARHSTIATFELQ